MSAIHGLRSLHDELSPCQRCQRQALESMRKVLKFLHTLAACGLIGALLGYSMILIYAPLDTMRSYADARQMISTLCNYLLLPSLAIALVTGLLAMLVHRPFQNTRWAWVKALLGLSLFEATLGTVQSKATTAAADFARIAASDGAPDGLAIVVANEWWALGALLALSTAQIVLGVWRPRLAKQ